MDKSAESCSSEGRNEGSIKQTKTDARGDESIAEGIDFMMNTDRKAIAEKAYKLCREKFSIEKMWDNYKKLFNS